MKNRINNKDIIKHLIILFLHCLFIFNLNIDFFELICPNTVTKSYIFHPKDIHRLVGMEEMGVVGNRRGLWAECHL